MPVKILDFPKIVDPRGSLTFLQNPQFIPFEIQRVFWLLNKAENKNSVGGLDGITAWFEVAEGQQL